jgi:signal transduction histidine kinase
MKPFLVVVFDENQLLKKEDFSIESFGDPGSFQYEVLHDQNELLKIDYTPYAYVIFTFEIKSEKRAQFIRSFVEKLEMVDKILLGFVEKNSVSENEIDLLNDKVVDRLTFATYQKDSLEEEVIASTITLAAKFMGSGGGEGEEAAGEESELMQLKEEAGLLDQVNKELQLRNQWMLEEKNTINFFGDISTSLDDKLKMTFHKVLEILGIEYFFYYSAEQKEENVKISFSFAGKLDEEMKVESHSFNQNDEAPSVFVFYNRKPVYIEDFSKNVKVEVNKKLKIDQCSGIIIPIFNQEEIVGVVEFYNTREELGKIIPMAVFKIIESLIQSLSFQIEIGFLKDEVFNSKNNMEDILNNINQGIVTFGEDLVIDGDCSKSTLTLFQQEQVKGLSILDLLFAEPRSEKMKEACVNFSEWCSLVFMDPDNWDLLKNIGMANLVLGESGVDSEDTSLATTKTYKLEYELIKAQGQRLGKIMVIATDISEKIAAEKESLRMKLEEDFKMKILMEIMKLDISVFNDFIREINQKLKGINTIISDNKENRASPSKIGDQVVARQMTEEYILNLYDNLFSHIHAIKGTSGYMGLTQVREKFHHIESKLVSIKNKNEVKPENIDALVEIIESDVRYFQDIVFGLLELLSKYSNQGPQSDTKSSDARMISFQMKTLSVLNFFKENWKGLQGKEATALSDLIQHCLSDIKNHKSDLINALKTNCVEAVKSIVEGKDKKVEVFIEVEDSASLRVIRNMQALVIPLMINAVDHGIEKSADRVQKGKAESGYLKLKVGLDRETKRTVLEIADDGNGIDISKLVAKALGSQIITPEAAEKMNEQEKIHLIFVPSLSTAEKITQTSGRGYGMDIIKKLVEKNNGEITVQTELGKGTKFILSFK